MINEQNKNTWCFNAEHALRLDNSYTGSSCCMMKSKHDHSDRNLTIMKMYDKPSLQKVRSDLNNGIKNAHCSLCWEEEEAGRDSKRVRDNKKYLDDLNNGISHQGITSLELNLGNTCNIKCRTCNPNASSLWAKEFYDLYADKSHFKSHSDYAKTISIYHQYYDEDRPFWDDLESHLPNLRNMVFYGGEPFLSKKMWKILDNAVKKGYSKNIILEYNTNGTTWPDAVKYWEHFKEVKVSFSIDGVHDQFNYMRFPADWNIVTENIKKGLGLSKNISYSWCVTLSPLNIFYLNEIVEEMDNNFKDIGLYLNLIHGPAHYNIKCIPNNIKEIIIEKISKLSDHYKAKYYLPGIIEFMKSEEDHKSWTKFLQVTKMHDEYRNQSYSKVFSEFAKIIGYNNE